MNQYKPKKKERNKEAITFWQGWFIGLMTGFLIALNLFVFK